ncbi:DNA metabolism protein [Lithospermum erythrorhizon]|uniref:DNA metabolism protein n=1 Tax=Lithospermum erythrorhizon TaxID=34254 RepID=A0AAV3P5T4_LITER
MASAFLVFGFKAEPPLVQLKAMDMVLFTKKTALPLAIEAFTTFSRCNSSLELLKVCTNVLEEVEKSFVTQIQDWCHGSFCWKKALHSHQKVDEYVWQEVTLLKAALLEARAKLLLRGGHFDSGEDLCRTCISIRTVMLGHNHAQTLAAQETLAKLVRMRSKIQH